jgi:hypothetical protein
LVDLEGVPALVGTNQAGPTLPQFNRSFEYLHPTGDWDQVMAIKACVMKGGGGHAEGERGDQDRLSPRGNRCA